MTPIRIAVVTPYYQTKPGLLVRALRSVFAQNLPEHVSCDCFVVDDASPHAAELEIMAFGPPERSRIHLLRQPNAGPAAARNTALDQIDPDRYRYVAFLDSDDEWQKSHISDALKALETGHDFYFCDHTRFDTWISYFDEGRQTADWRKAKTADIHVLDEDGPVLSIAPQTAFEAFLTEYLSQTSTVVYRLDAAPDHRFVADQRKAGEDFLFWLGLLQRGLRCAVNYRPNVHCGDGVNLYASAYDFASPKVVERVGYILLCNLRIKDDFWSVAENKAFIDTQITRYTRAYGYLFVRSLLMGQRPNLSLFARILRKAPLRALSAPVTFLSVWPTRTEEAALW